MVYYAIILACTIGQDLATFTATLQKVYQEQIYFRMKEEIQKNKISPVPRI